MCFGEPHPFPERGSPTKLSASGQQSYEGWSCRLLRHYKLLTKKSFPRGWLWEGWRIRIGSHSSTCIRSWKKNKN